MLILGLEDMPIFYNNPEIEKKRIFFLDAWLTWATYTILTAWLNYNCTIVLYAYAWFYDQETTEIYPL